MKRNLFAPLILFVLTALILLPTKSFAVDTIPNTSVWFTPEKATAGTAITLNALVYNNQPADATVTIVFKTDKGIIGTQTQLVAAQSAKTFVQKWIMPSTATVVTASVTGALDKNKKSIPTLVGVVGLVTVGGAPLINTSAIPGGSKFTAWLTPVLSKIETFRVSEAAGYAALQNTTKITLGITPNTQPTPVSDGLPPVKFDNPVQYIILVYATACASFFGNFAIFYIGLVLILLLAIRFIVNLFL